MSFIDEIDEMRNPEVVARERQEAAQNKVSTRIIDSGLDAAEQVLQASEQATLFQYRDKENDAMLRSINRLGRLEHVEEFEARQRAGMQAGRDPGLEARTEQLYQRVASPSSASADVQMDL